MVIYTEAAARLEWKSFFVAGNAKAKRLGTEGGKAAPINIKKIKTKKSRKLLFGILIYMNWKITRKA